MSVVGERAASRAAVLGIVLAVVAVVVAVAVVAVAVAHPPGSGQTSATQESLWWLDGPDYASPARIRESADHVVEARVDDLLAAGPESELLGGDSPLPLQLWSVRILGQNSRRGGGSLAVAVVDAQQVHGVEQHLRSGQIATLALKCGPHRFRGHPVCSPVGLTRGIDP